MSNSENITLSRNDPNRQRYGDFECILPDAYLSRMCFEIMSHISTDGIIRFMKDGVRIIHRNQEQSIVISYFFSERNLISYYISHPGDKIPEFEYYCDTSMRSLGDICKPLGKTDGLILCGKIDESGIVVAMNNIRNESSACRVVCNELNLTNVENHTDMLSKYYPDLKPTAKITGEEFSKTMRAFKSTKCVSMIFTLTSDRNVHIGGWKDGYSDVIKCWKNESKNLGESEEDYPEKLTIGGDNGPSLVIENYSIKLECKKTLELFNKISRLSGNRTVILIYLKESSPLILKVKIGNMGDAIFAFVGPSSG